MDLKKIDLVTNRKGFTLIELIAVMIIMAVMVSVAIKKLELLSDSASITALKSGVRELNTRETLVWVEMKLSNTGWTADAEVYNAVDKSLGVGYGWNPGPTITGGTLYHKSQSVILIRNQSTKNTVGSWN